MCYHNVEWMPGFAETYFGGVVRQGKCIYCGEKFYEIYERDLVVNSDAKEVDYEYQEMWREEIQ